MDLERIKILAQIKESKAPSQTIVEKLGKLAVVLEGQYYYIMKEGKDGKYTYLLGENNKTKNYQYTSASSALKNMKLMEGMSLGYGFKNEADEEAPAPEQEPAPEAEAEPAPEQEPAPAPEEGGDAPAVDSEGGEDTSWIDDIDAEGDGGEAPAEDGGEAPAGDSEGGESLTAMEAAGEVQNILGKVSDSGAQEAYNALAQILSSVDDTLTGLMNPEDLVKAGKKFQELADKYAPKEESVKRRKTMAESKKTKKPFDKLTEAEIQSLMESTGVMNKPSIKRRLAKLEKLNERAKILESKIERRNRLNESRSKKKKGK